MKARDGSPDAETAYENGELALVYDKQFHGRPAKLAYFFTNGQLTQIDFYVPDLELSKPQVEELFKNVSGEIKRLLKPRSRTEIKPQQNPDHVIAYGAWLKNDDWIYLKIDNTKSSEASPFILHLFDKTHPENEKIISLIFFTYFKEFITPAKMSSNSLPLAVLFFVVVVLGAAAFAVFLHKRKIRKTYEDW